MKQAGISARGAWTRKRLSAALMAGTALTMTATPTLAQDEQGQGEQDKVAASDDNVIVVSGIRATIQDSIATKKEATTIVDALSSEEIGDLPALSIGEALETLTGAASHREQGGATEISIRGLGPFLGSTTLNGREATNGSGDRSVNFSQFPSELFNKVAIYKTQEANFIEGGVSGQIRLETVRPIDYGKRRIQGDFKLNYNPDNSALNIRERNLGYRGTVSYIDQFKLGDGEVGISLGYSRNVTTNPEQEVRSSSGFRDCRLAPASTNEGVFEDDNCDDNGSVNNPGGDLILEIDPATGTAFDAGTPFLFTSSQRSFRQNITNDNRDSVFAAVQLKPTPDVDINFDFQYSDRKFTEIRNDLVFAENRRIDAADVDPSRRLPFDLIVTPAGSLQQFTSEQRIETNSQYAERLEEYYGGGLSIAVQATDKLNLSFDASYSETSRRENIIQTRLQSDREDIFGNFVLGTNSALERGSNSIQRDRVETATFIGQNGSQGVNFIVRNFDVTNPDLFADDARTRVDLNQFRNNNILGIRGDFNYEIDGGLLSNIQGGFRYSELGFDSVPRSRLQETYSDAALTTANLACRNSVFPENNFLSSISGGNALVTNVDAAGNIITQGTGNSYATFDPICLVQQLEAADPGDIEFDENGFPIIPGPQQTLRNVDVTERTWAGYLQANFSGELGNTPVRGNIGLRVVNTRVRSTGLRGALISVVDPNDGTIDVIPDPAGTLLEVTGGGTYTEYLPSLNLVAEVAPNVQARAAVYRALSRPDPSDLGFGRSFGGLQDDTITDLSNAIANATANGNPFTQPLLSWNFDAAVEWYPNPDTILAAGVYYKRFNGGFQNTTQIEEFIVDGQPLQALVTTQDTIGDPSTIYGFEFTASHRLSYLPKPLDGLGFKVSYNYASSNFEFEDAQFGASQVFGANGTLVDRVGIVPPAEIFGLSKHVLSAQVYYQIAGFDFQGVYKYRSSYFQQFISSPGNLRFIGNTGVFEARLSYKLTKNIRFTIEGINLFNEPRRQFNPTRENISEVNVYGPRYFAGVKFKF
ncbi:TonB-dependent receptor [hydrothermal vent metagenome]|uniref:TonB-dependent receptor n=1 Tax=hydrothermal vent metagenome TaxID=652676 RepID=A0A3B0STD5_9ZZZZ